MHTVIAPDTVSNRDFLLAHAQPGRVGLAGLAGFIDHRIQRSQRRAHPERLASLWSHAFLFEGQRLDGEHWLLESDLDISGRHIRLGVQENRIEKYCDDAAAPALAVIDFGLDADQARQALAAGLDLLATQAAYPIRKALATWLAVRLQDLRRTFGPEDERALYCSAFVRHCYKAAGVDLVPGVDRDNTLPEHLASSPVGLRMWVLSRAAG